MSVRTMLIAIATGLAACASSPPTNPGNPSADFAADRWDCQKQVAALPPPPQQVAAAAPESRVTLTKCTPGFSGVECRSSEHPATSTPTDAMFKTMAQLQANRANEERASAWRNCMMAKGWR